MALGFPGSLARGNKVVCTVVTFFKAALPMGESKPSPRDGTINNCLAKCNALQQSVYTSKWEIHGALANMFVHEDGGYRWFMSIPSPRLSLRDVQSHAAQRHPGFRALAHKGVLILAPAAAALQTQDLPA